MGLNLKFFICLPLVIILASCASAGLKYEVVAVNVYDKSERTLTSSGCVSICSDLMGGAWCDYYSERAIAQCKEHNTFNEYRKTVELIKRYHRKAKEGDPESLKAVGLMYYYGHGVKKDYKEALKWFKFGAEKNHAHSQYGLGLLYFMGHGVQKDHVAAVKWFRLAAENQSTDAEYSLGVMLYMGFGVDIDKMEGLRLIKKSAASGNSHAQQKLRELGI